LVILGALSFPDVKCLAENEKALSPLPKAHAHNDYRHQRPLLDALSFGFCSVEADVFLVDGQLLVAHDRIELNPSRTLDSLYLRPLMDRVKKNKGSVYPSGPRFTLLIDFKADGAATYEALRVKLEPYREMLAGFRGGAFCDGAVQIVVSGDRPVAEIIADADRLVGIDGRLSDLESNLPSETLPLISDRWDSHFKWRGVGTIGETERQHLRDIVRKAHHADRRVRFWATPESEAVWDELVSAGVDHINTDQLDRLSRYLQVRPRQ
jgi:glycerophosphoryl diester phosphodiesterase